MIECRRLKESELNRLLEEAPESETRNLKEFCDEYFLTPYELFDEYGFENIGILEDGRPIYVAALTNSKDGNYEMWTVVNSEPLPQFSLFKYAKKHLKKWVKNYGKIYATMDTDKQKNMEWTQKLGFHKIREIDKTITFEIIGD